MNFALPIVVILLVLALPTSGLTSDKKSGFGSFDETSVVRRDGILRSTGQATSAVTLSDKHGNKFTFSGQCNHSVVSTVPLRPNVVTCSGFSPSLPNCRARWRNFDHSSFCILTNSTVVDGSVIPAAIVHIPFAGSLNSWVGQRFSLSSSDLVKVFPSTSFGFDGNDRDYSRVDVQPHASCFMLRGESYFAPSLRVSSLDGVFDSFVLSVTGQSATESFWWGSVECEQSPPTAVSTAPSGKDLLVTINSHSNVSFPGTWWYSVPSCSSRSSIRDHRPQIGVSGSGYLQISGDSHLAFNLSCPMALMLAASSGVVCVSQGSEVSYSYYTSPSYSDASSNSDILPSTLPSLGWDLEVSSAQPPFRDATFSGSGQPFEFSLCLDEAQLSQFVETTGTVVLPKGSLVKVRSSDVSGMSISTSSFAANSRYLALPSFNISSQTQDELTGAAKTLIIVFVAVGVAFLLCLADSLGLKNLKGPALWIWRILAGISVIAVRIVWLIFCSILAVFFSLFTKGMTPVSSSSWWWGKDQLLAYLADMRAKGALKTITKNTKMSYSLVVWYNFSYYWSEVPSLADAASIWDSIEANEQEMTGPKAPSSGGSVPPVVVMLVGALALISPVSAHEQSDLLMNYASICRPIDSTSVSLSADSARMQVYGMLMGGCYYIQQAHSAIVIDVSSYELPLVSVGPAYATIRESEDVRLLSYAECGVREPGFLSVGRGVKLSRIYEMNSSATRESFRMSFSSWSEGIPSLNQIDDDLVEPASVCKVSTGVLKGWDCPLAINMGTFFSGSLDSSTARGAVCPFVCASALMSSRSPWRIVQEVMIEAGSASRSAAVYEIIHGSESRSITVISDSSPTLRLPGGALFAVVDSSGESLYWGGFNRFGEHSTELNGFLQYSGSRMMPAFLQLFSEDFSWDGAFNADVWGAPHVPTIPPSLAPVCQTSVTSSVVVTKSSIPAECTSAHFNPGQPTGVLAKLGNVADKVFNWAAGLFGTSFSSTPPKDYIVKVCTPKEEISEVSIASQVGWRASNLALPARVRPSTFAAGWVGVSLNVSAISSFNHSLRSEYVCIMQYLRSADLSACPVSGFCPMPDPPCVGHLWGSLRPTLSKSWLRSLKKGGWWSVTTSPSFSTQCETWSQFPPPTSNAGLEPDCSGYSPSPSPWERGTDATYTEQSLLSMPSYGASLSESQALVGCISYLVVDEACRDLLTGYPLVTIGFSALAGPASSVFYSRAVSSFWAGSVILSTPGISSPSCDWKVGPNAPVIPAGAKLMPLPPGACTALVANYCYLTCDQQQAGQAVEFLSAMGAAFASPSWPHPVAFSRLLEGNMSSTFFMSSLHSLMDPASSVLSFVAPSLNRLIEESSPCSFSLVQACIDSLSPLARLTLTWNYHSGSAAVNVSVNGLSFPVACSYGVYSSLIETSLGVSFEGAPIKLTLCGNQQQISYEASSVVQQQSGVSYVTVSTAGISLVSNESGLLKFSTNGCRGDGCKRGSFWDPLENLFKSGCSDAIAVAYHNAFGYCDVDSHGCTSSECNEVVRVFVDFGASIAYFAILATLAFLAFSGSVVLVWFVSMVLVRLGAVKTLRTASFPDKYWTVFPIGWSSPVYAKLATSDETTEV